MNVVVDAVRHDVDLLARYAKERLELGGGELRDGDHAVRGPQHARHRERHVAARPPWKRLGMAEHREVVDRDDGRHARAKRAVVRRAVQHVGTAAEPREAKRVPPQLAREHRRPVSAAECDRLHLEPLAEVADVARRARVRQPQRRDVHRDLHRRRSHAARCASPFASHVNERACVEPLRHELRPAFEGAADRRRDRAGILRIRPHCGIAARLVERRMRRRDDGHAAGHRLDDRHPEPFEERRVDERRSPRGRAAAGRPGACSRDGRCRRRRARPARPSRRLLRRRARGRRRAARVPRRAS